MFVKFMVLNFINGGIETGYIANVQPFYNKCKLTEKLSCNKIKRFVKDDKILPMEYIKGSAISFNGPMGILRQQKHEAHH